MKHKDDYENDEFDDVELDEEESRGDVLRWLSVAFVVSAVVGFLALAWYAYQSSMEPVSEDEIPYVAADTEPFKEKPEDPGGLQFEHQDKTVYNQLASGDGASRAMAERLLPPPEEPVERVTPEPLKPEEFEKEPVESQAPADSPKAAAVKPVESVPLAATPEKQDEKVTVVPSTKSETETMVVIEPQKPAAKPAPEKKVASVTTATAKPGQFMAQLGAFSSQEEAKAAWAKISAAHGSAFPTQKHVLQRADVGGKTYHRLQVGPFESEAAARKTCSYLQERKQACFVVSVK